MAQFTNQAFLSMNGVQVASNIATGEVTETLALIKTATPTTYKQGDIITYAVSLVNSGTTAMTGLTITDNLGAYTCSTTTAYPLTYVAGSILYYQNGTLQTAPTVTAGPPLTITGITVPANGDVVLVYRCTANDYANPNTGGTVTNTATATGDGLSDSISDYEVIDSIDEPELSIVKSICPVPVTENGTVTYTFTISNSGNTAVAAADNLVLTDTFDPALSGISVTYNGTTWPAANYTYTGGVFTTTTGSITVPAATITQNTDCSYTVTPGTTTIKVTGTI